MPRAFRATSAPAPEAHRPLYIELENTPLEFTGTSPQPLLADAYFWRSHSRDLLGLARHVAEESLTPAPQTMQWIVGALNAALLLDHLVEANLQRACDLMGIDYTGAMP